MYILAEFLAIFRLDIRDLGKKNVRSRETRKNQGNLEAAVKGNSHGGLAGMHDGSGSASEELFTDVEEGISSPLIPIQSSSTMRSRATAAFTRSGADNDCSTTDDESHRDAGRGAGDRRHINPKLKVTCLGGLP